MNTIIPLVHIHRHHTLDYLLIEEKKPQLSNNFFLNDFGINSKPFFNPSLLTT